MAKITQKNPIALAMYEAAERSRRTEKPRRYLGMSQIGEPCPRKLWYGFRGVRGIPIEGRVIMIFRFGDRIEEEIVRWLNLAGYEVTGQQTAYQAHNGIFRGHSDGIIYGITKKAHVLEIKSANDKSFKAFKKYGVKEKSPTYYGQMQAYMGYGGLERALFLVQNKNNCEIHTERIYFDREAFDGLHQKAYDIITASNPPAPFYDEDSKQCGWCDFRFPCWQPETGIMAIEHCGTCGTFRYTTGPVPMCTNEKHPFEIRQKGAKCPDYENMFTKKWIELEGKRYLLKGVY